jgi:hypothetical protein
MKNKDTNKNKDADKEKGKEKGMEKASCCIMTWKRRIRTITSRTRTRT